MPEINFEIDPDPVDWTDPEPPEGGWVTAPCEHAESPWAFHNWQLEIEEGRAVIRCADPCDVNPEHLDPQGKIPVCIAVANLYDPESYGTPEPIPVKVEGIVEKYPGGPWGATEYDFYINIEAKP